MQQMQREKDAIAGSEDRGRGREPRNVAPLEAGKDKEIDPPLEPPGGTLEHLDFGPGRLLHKPPAQTGGQRTLMQKNQLGAEGRETGSCIYSWMCFRSLCLSEGRGGGFTFFGMKGKTIKAY